MKLKTSTLIWVFIWSLFMGVTAISIGVGAAYPPLNYIAAPVICPGGQMSVNSTVYNPYPGTTVTTEDWICTNNRTGAQTPLSIFKISLVAGLVYGLLLFIVIAVLWPLGGRLLQRANTNSSEPGNAGFHTQSAAEDDPEEQELRHLERSEKSEGGSASGNSERRLRELEKLRSSNLITQSEYDKKRGEILSSL